MNEGIRASSGAVLLRVDGHVVVAPDFVRQSVRALLDHPEAWVTGGVLETIGDTFVGRAISAVMSSPIGAGNARFRLGAFKGFVEHVPFPCYWRWVFDKVGLFDEELVRNQDDELNQRIIRAGGKIYLDSDIRSQYYSRGSLRSLARQYYQYGFWRVRTIQKHGRPATLRQTIPLLFVLVWIVLIFGAVFWLPARYALAGFAALYAAGLAIGTLQVGFRNGWRIALLVPIVAPLLHFTYGLGSLKGVWFWIILRGRWMPPDSVSRLSR